MENQETNDAEAMPSGEDIFTEAAGKPVEQTENSPETPPEAPTEAKTTRARDEKGKFVSKAPEETSPVVEPASAEPPVETKPEDKTPERIPLAEYLSEREKRQNEQRQREALQQQLFQLQQELRAKTAPAPEPVDIFADPQGWEKSFEERILAKQRELEGNFSLRMAKFNHKEKFDEAWKAMVERTQNGDDSVRQQVINSPDPGETLVNWYKREETINLVGDNPETFAQRILDEALENPEFLAKAIEKAKGKAATQPTQVHLPPSLNKGTASVGKTDAGDVSDAGLWQSVWQR